MQDDNEDYGDCQEGKQLQQEAVEEYEAAKLLAKRAFDLMENNPFRAQFLEGIRFRASIRLLDVEVDYDGNLVCPPSQH